MWFLKAFNSNPQFAMLQVVILVFSICLHEYMHARVALHLGDDTATRAGHLTLNPMKQMGWFSLILMFVVGIAFGSVPVNQNKIRGKYGSAIVSFAGPFANLMLAIMFFTALIAVVQIPEPSDKNRIIVAAMLFASQLNLVLFILNIIPIPPLDGYGIAESFFPKLRSHSSEFINGAYLFLIMALFYSGQYIFLLANKIISKGLLSSPIDMQHLIFYFA